MTALSVSPAYPIFTDRAGQPLENGYIWIGAANQPPQTNPIAVFWDAALTQPAAQPVRTINGYPSNSGTPGRLYVGSDYSLMVQDAKGSVVYSAPASTERVGNVSSDSVFFVQAGIDAITRTMQDKLRDVVSVKDFGAVGNGVANDTDAIQAALNATPNGGELFFPAGTYVVAAEISLSAKSNIALTGSNALIRGSTTRFRSYFAVTNCTNVRVDGLRFDHLQSSLPTYLAADYPTTYNCAFFVTGTNGFSVSDCAFENLYTLSIYFFNSSSLTVSDCVFSSPVPNQDQWLQFVHLQTFGGLNVIARNRFESGVTTNPALNPCAVFVSGGASTSSVLIADNYTNYCGRDNAGTHRLGVFDIYGDAQNVIVENNTSMNCMSQFMRLSATRNGKVRKNRVMLNANAELDYSILTVESVIAFSPGQVGCQDIEIADNVFEDAAARCAYAIGVLSYDWGAPSLGIRVNKNSFIGPRRSVVVAGPFNDVQIVGNHSRNGFGRIEVEHNGTNAANVTSTVGAESSSRFDNLLISQNVTLNDSGSDSNAVTISFLKSPAYTGSLGRLAIQNNSFRKFGTVDGGQAISVQGAASSLQGRLTIEGNETQNYTYDWYVRTIQEVVIRNNRAIASGVAPLLEDGSNGTIWRSGNRLSTGALVGSVTLVAGTATVSTTEIRTGDRVLLYRQATGGTLGNLSVGTITSGTSFVINSSSATDTSVVYWQIEH